MKRPTFDWWDDAVEVANRAAAYSGVRQRVRWVGGSTPWQVMPAAPRLVEVTC